MENKPKKIEKTSSVEIFYLEKTDDKVFLFTHYFDGSYCGNENYHTIKEIPKSWTPTSKLDYEITSKLYDNVDFVDIKNTEMAVMVRI